MKTKSATQVQKTPHERWENREKAFYLNPKKELSLYEGKNILLVDDIITTGATLVNAAIALKQLEGVKIQILTLAIARPA